jgi:hypothetical protein
MKLYVPGMNVEANTDDCGKFGVWMFYGVAPCCTNCGSKQYSRPSKFCPECGAMMLNVAHSIEMYDANLNEICKDAAKDKEVLVGAD